MNKLIILKKNNIVVDRLEKEKPLLLESILEAMEEYAEYYHKNKVEKSKK
jgi:hypothetical protein